MTDLLQGAQRRLSEEPLFRVALLIGILTTLTALAVYAYLGIFSRYSSDDYCLSAFFLQGDLWSALVRRYYVSTSRYTNVLFIGLADVLFGWYNVAILPALMLGLFVVGLYLVLREIDAFARLAWGRWMALLLALLIVYFSVSQAPDLYETLYWRAGMTSHFAPLVFIPYLGAFLLRQMRRADERSPSPWVQAASFLIPFLVGGLSEPPTTLMITALFLALAAAAWWSEPQARRARLIVLFWALFGALAALVVMAVAPANSLRMQTPPPGLVVLIGRVVNYPLFFIVDTLRALPVPTLISVAVTAVLFYVQYAQHSGASKEAGNRLILWMLAALVLGYLLIAASFAPSAYGQSYPVPRARFIGRLVMTLTLMTEGALLGILAAQLRSTPRSAVVRRLAAAALIVLLLYPLRTAWRMSQEIPVYRQRAAVWDARDAEIRSLRDRGERDVVIWFLSEVPIQDLGDRTGYRLNRCAAALYGIDSIVAVPMEGK